MLLQNDCWIGLAGVGLAGVGLADVGLAGVGLADVGLAGVGLAGVDLAGVGLADVGLAGVGLAGVGLAGVGLADVGLAGVGLAGVGLAGVGLADVGLADVCLGDVGLADVGLADVGLAGVGFAGVGLADVGLADVCLGDVGLADVGLAGVGLAGVGLADVGMIYICYHYDVVYRSKLDTLYVSNNVLTFFPLFNRFSCLLRCNWRGLCCILFPDFSLFRSRGWFYKWWYPLSSYKLVFNIFHFSSGSCKTILIMLNCVYYPFTLCCHFSIVLIVTNGYFTMVSNCHSAMTTYRAGTYSRDALLLRPIHQDVAKSFCTN